MSILAMAYILIFSTFAFAGETGSLSTKTDANGYYTITSEDYLNTVNNSVIMLPLSFDKAKIEAISVCYANQFVSALSSINKNVLSITPSTPLVDGATYTVRIFTSDNKRYSLTLKAYNVKKIDYTKDNLFKIPANPAKGFNYDYYLYVPSGANKSSIKRLMVEPNNTGRPSDSLEFHDEYAKRIAIGQWNGGVGNYVAQNLKTPLLVPTFPRPAKLNEVYTHALNRGAIQTKDENLKRLDLQLIAMIGDAQKTLSNNGLKVESKVFMTGFSASGHFSQRFTLLHPEKVKAIYSQGTSTLPTTKIGNTTANYPIGIADIKELTGKDFNATEYAKVAQFIYMGDQDDHDILDEYSQSLPGSENFPYLWEDVTKAFLKLGYGKSMQFHTYKGIGHSIPTTAYVDSIAFFKANNGDKIVKINAHNEAYDVNWYNDLQKVLKDVK